MAAALVDALVVKLGAKLVDPKKNEASLFFNFIKDFEWLNEKLLIVSTYLKDADLHSSHNKFVDKWLLDVADIAWYAEDILQQCAVEYVHSNDGNTKSSGVICAFNYSQFVSLYKMGRRIKDIRDKMRSVMEDAAELKLVPDLTHSEQASTSTSQNVQKKRPNVLERDARPVGIEPKVEEILKLLDDPASPVIAVVGMGGVGKTFLLQNVFNRIKDRFDNSIWLAISETYSVKKLQSDLACRMNPIGNVYGRERDQINLIDVIKGRIRKVRAAEFIRSQLQSTRSLIVLDDVSREDDLISTLGLPRGNNTQCKILVTTRRRDFLRNMNARVYEMTPLSKEESWELFCAFAFSDCDQNRQPPHLVQITHQIVEKCGGLPLFVKVVAASLADKASLKVWESKLRELQEVADRDDRIMEILKLSYVSLPLSLKPVFTFLSFFPADEVIDCEYMINLWIGEGFISEEEDQWETGWAHLQLLNDRCLVKVGENFHLKKYCQVNKLIFDLAIYLSSNSKCVFSSEKAFAKSIAKTTKYQRILLPKTTKHRRILLASSGIDDDTIAENRFGSPGFVSTLSLCRNRIESIPANFFADMNVLRTLDLSRTDIFTLPESVGNLKLLRILNLCSTQIKEVPNCVRNVTRLCFLDISRCREVRQLPAWIGELKYMEHLNVADCSEELASCMPSGLSKLSSLRILRSDYLNCSIQENKILKLEHIAELAKLQELCINVKHVMELNDIEKGILQRLAKMRSLAIANEISPLHLPNAAVLPTFPHSMKSMNELEKLYLWNFSVPNSVIDNFKELRLIEISGSCSYYPDLENLPCLERLMLLHNNNVTELPTGFGKAGGFPNLRFLEISDVPVLKEFPDLEEGAMARLEKLSIHRCEGLKKIPEGLERVKSLQEIEVREGSRELTRRLRKGGQDSTKLTAIIPFLKISVLWI